MFLVKIFQDCLCACHDLGRNSRRGGGELAEGGELVREGFLMDFLFFLILVFVVGDLVEGVEVWC